MADTILFRRRIRNLVARTRTTSRPLTPTDTVPLHREFCMKTNEKPPKRQRAAAEVTNTPAATWDFHERSAETVHHFALGLPHDVPCVTRGLLRSWRALVLSHVRKSPRMGLFGKTKRKTKRKTLTAKQRAQRVYASRMRTVRKRATGARRGSGRIAKRAAATKLRRKLGLKSR